MATCHISGFVMLLPGVCNLWLVGGMRSFAVAAQFIFRLVEKTRTEPRRAVVSFLQVNNSEVQAEFFYDLFYGRANFAAKLCNSAQRTAKGQLRITWHQKGYGKQ